MKKIYLFTAVWIFTLSNFTNGQSAYDNMLINKKDSTKEIPENHQKTNLLYPAQGTYVSTSTSSFPFYGFTALGYNRAYFMYDDVQSQLEYHQASESYSNFTINGNNFASFYTNFVGINTSTPQNIYTAFGIKTSNNDWYGMYIDAGPAGKPFYGYALDGVQKAYTQFNGTNNAWELNYNGVQLNVASTGYVGIGAAIPSQKLDVNGTIHAQNLNGGATTLSTDANGDIIRTPSDARLKTRIVPIDGALDKVLHLQGVYYNFKDPDRFGSGRQMGFLAQDLEKVIPETVSSGGEYKSVNYGEITALLVEALKEQQKTIDELRSRIEILENR